MRRINWVIQKSAWETADLFHVEFGCHSPLDMSRAVLSSNALVQGLLHSGILFSPRKEAEDVVSHSPLVSLLP